MNTKLKDELLDLRNFLGASAAVKLPVSRDIINLALKDVEIPKIRSIFLERISKDGMDFFIKTTVPLHRKITIRLKLFPKFQLPEFLVTAEVVSGLNQVQRFIIDMITDNKLEFEGNRVTIQLISFLQSNLVVAQYLPLLKDLLVETADDKLILAANLKID